MPKAHRFIAIAQSTHEFTGLVVAITDGDTFKVMHDGVAERVRLNGIDAPEKKQPFGTKARQFAGDLAFQKVVTVQVKGKDRYGRTVADVVLPDGRVLNRELVKAGMAWWYRKYAPRDEVLERLEGEARAARVGLWSDHRAVPPWEFRAVGKVAK